MSDEGATAASSAGVAAGVDAGGVSVDVQYLSAGANRHTAVADWSEDGIVAFGADCNVALWRPNDVTPRGITHLLSGHKEVVKAVKFLPRKRKEEAARTADDQQRNGNHPPTGSGSVSPSYLLSGADDQHLNVWRLSTPSDKSDGERTGEVLKATSNSSVRVECIQTVHAHSAAVNCIAVLGELGRRGSWATTRRTEPWIFATGAADASVKVWSFIDIVVDDGAVPAGLQLLQTIRPSPKLFPLALAISELDGDNEKKEDGGDNDGEEKGTPPLVLAVAGTRDIVQIYVADSIPFSNSDVGINGNATSNNNDDDDDSPALLNKEPDDGGFFRLQATLSGHEGWIRSLDFAREEPEDGDGSGSGGGDLILASASQDKYIRLWRFHAGAELPPAAAAAAADPTDPASILGRAAGGAGVKSPSNKAHRLKTTTAHGRDTNQYSITFEALLLGHDDWIYSAKWRPKTITNNRTTLQLLSASADNTLAIWEADPSSGIWVTAARLGEISREKGATTATGSTGGFWTGLWAPDARSVACLGRTGSWRVWGLDADDEDGDGRWMPRVGITGHTRAVTGIAWSGRGDGESGSGDYLLSTSADQTTRLHAPWVVNGRRNRNTYTWHEMGRPQIHGYDLNCVDSLGAAQFVSGADEKLMRVFDEPGSVARLLHQVSGITSSGGGSGDTNHLRPDAADMPVLGLSNKAIVDEDDNDNDNDNDDVENGAPATTGENSQEQTTAPAPPSEDALSRHTLWPEAEKLYGHGYEVSCLAGSHSGRLVASACRASSANHAVIRLFETAPRWTEIRPPLAAHSLTATRLRFSPPGDRYLLSVGRDRVWAVFEREGAGDDGEGAERDGGAPVHDEEEGGKSKSKSDSSGNSSGSGDNYKLLQSNPKGHSRMILDAAWAPAPLAEAQVVFATAGRDKQVKVWRRDGAGTIVCATAIPETHPVTAVDFLPRIIIAGGQGQGQEHQRLVLAVGTEAGRVSLHGLDAATQAVAWSLTLRPELCLAKAVSQLSWRPQRRAEGDDEDGGGIDGDELAIAGEDGSLRIYSFANLAR